MRLAALSCGLLLAVALLPGCDSPTPTMNYGSIDLVKAGGKVTLDGQPLTGAVVIFENPEDSTFSFAQTDSSGTYRLQFDSKMAGVRPGSKIVRISTTKKLEGLNAEEGGEEATGEGEDGKPLATGDKPQERVPAKYNTESELEVEVTLNQTTYDFELKSEGQ